MEDKINIRITIAERVYPMIIDRDEEEIVRKAARGINELLAKYKRTFSGHDIQDYLVMAALQYSKDNLRHKVGEEDKKFENELISIERQLDAIIEQQ
ncbi:MAG: cell division protein ZapA [Bacteroidetes bacterium HGW-Bacteroidetes-21]|jgi:cell division protein ZapA|nr:MAG: cell division protein ZapA [Bacteroidetes bacterium HGW-Bacteroidetes-21]